MIRIRNNVFETNSSSSHVFTFSKKNVNKYFTEKDMKNDYHACNGQIKTEDLYFGRSPFQVLLHPVDKAKYVIACTHCKKYDDAYVEIMTALQEIYPDLYDIKFPDRNYIHKVCNDKELWLINNIKIITLIPYFKELKEIIDSFCDEGYNIRTKRNGEVVVEKTEEDENNTWGGVDDVELFPSFMKKYNLAIRDFILRKDIIVIVDGDEYCIYQDMKDAGIIKSMEEYDNETMYNDKEIDGNS